MAQMTDGWPLFGVRGTPKFIVEWLDVTQGDEGELVQVGYIRTGCASLDEVRAELRARWGDTCLWTVSVLVRNQTGRYDFMPNDEWKDSGLESSFRR